MLDGVNDDRVESIPLNFAVVEPQGRELVHRRPGARVCGASPL